MRVLTQARKYLYETRFFILGIVVLFAVSAFFGFIFAKHLSFLDAFLLELLAKTAGLGIGALISFIFFNNVQSALFGLLFGIFFGIFPLLTSLVNGLVLGYVFHRVYAITGIHEFWRILPHGIFELPAVFIALGLGLRLGMFLFSKKPLHTLKERFILSLVLFLAVIVPLLIIAAIIEGILISWYT